MPSVSKAQAHMMAWAAHDPKFAARKGIPMSVAKEFHEADKVKAGKKFISASCPWCKKGK